MKEAEATNSPADNGLAHRAMEEMTRRRYRF